MRLESIENKNEPLGNGGEVCRAAQRNKGLEVASPANRCKTDRLAFARPEWLPPCSGQTRGPAGNSPRGRVPPSLPNRLGERVHAGGGKNN